MSTKKQLDLLQFKASADINHRLEFATTLLNNSYAKIHHLDDLRQRNLVLTVLIFAGLFSYTLQLDRVLLAAVGGTILSGIMLILLMIERNLSKYNEGWQATHIAFIRLTENIINDPTIDREVCRYDEQTQANSKFRGYRAYIHVALVFGGPVALVVSILK
jgi:hypothetical protein